MKQYESSFTSLVSAFARAYHSKFDTPIIFDDFLARQLITEDEFKEISRHMIQGISFFNKDIALKFKGNSDEILKWITQVQLSPTPLARSAYTEKVLENEILLGLRQFVILGAGLDTFAFRHPELKNILKIFEIDHPSTQAFKKNRLASMDFEIPNNLHFTSIDFTQDFTYQDLLIQGLKNQKTLYSLLGVSYYLTKQELVTLIQTLFAIVPSGSSIVFDYADEHLFEQKGLSNRVENMVKMAAASGEPMKACFTYEEMEHLLEKSGLLIYEHLTPATIQEQFFSNRSDYLSAFESIHYIHAVKK
ncbi:class I SAM-dependent methyltransferase [Radiobacillus deserti]|uniref:S-adenosyl-L-methionine-dependent methyltransferase n=1 Tax=Radiobacillus deserti TaxID=2594883 RepID=A0A516KHM4_9BACI|nr:class I SAM-dependent methyltransferase [Radiobacillus deserti]QDP40887.1 class I SAM-dependent methyltransferase [Radiobacillus deserti]